MAITTPGELRPRPRTSMHACRAADPRATRWRSTLPHASIEDTRVWLDGMIARNADGRDDFVIERDGQVIGKAGCFEPPEVGYILHPDHRGLGWASKPWRRWTCLPRGAIDDLTADVDPANQASIRLLERLGFVRTGRRTDLECRRRMEGRPVLRPDRRAWTRVRTITSSP